MSVLVGTPFNDTLAGDDGADNVLTGLGGDDKLVGGLRGVNALIGDTGDRLVFNNSIRGADLLIGGAESSNFLVGDAVGLIRGAIGGDDVLIGGAGGSNVMFGDTSSQLFEQSLGGNDTLIAGDRATNTLVGDADVLASGSFGAPSLGGDDILVSGTGDDEMFGDGRNVGQNIGGRDIFRFLANNGHDTVHDFERGKDLIDANGVRLVAFAGQSAIARAGLVQSTVGTLDIEEIDVNKDGKRDSVIHIDANNSVTVLGVTGLAEAVLPGGGTSYVLFGRTSLPQGTRDKWAGSDGGNSQAGTTPGSDVERSAFNSDTATAAGAALAGPGAADYAADGVLMNARVVMFDLTEEPAGVLATGAAADLEGRIASGIPLFGAATTSLDLAQSDIDLSAGRLHLAQTDRNWNGIKNIEISLDSATSFHDIRLENFVDTRLKLGDVLPFPGAPQVAPFDVLVLGAKRGEIDASIAPQAMNLVVEVWTNSADFQNSFDIKGSVFPDVVSIGPGDVTGSSFGQSESWYQRSEEPQGIYYVGKFTTIHANLGAENDQFDSLAEFRTSEGALIAGNGQFRTMDHVWGGTGSDEIHGGYGDDRLFGDQGSGAWSSGDPLNVSGFDGNDELWGGPGADWLEGNGDHRDAGIVISNGTPVSVQIGPLTERIDCGFRDGDRDIVNFNKDDGFDAVTSFEPGIDVLRMEASVFNGNPTGQFVVASNFGPGLFFMGNPGRVFLVGITTPLSQSTDGDYLLFS